MSPSLPALEQRFAADLAKAYNRIATLETQMTQALARANNLSDLANAATARANLGLAGAAILPVGTTAGTVAAGDDSRITSAPAWIGTTVLGSSAASISITIPAGFTHLQGTFTARQDSGAGGAYCLLRYNGDSGNNYAHQDTLGNQAAISAANSAGLTNGVRVGVLPGSGDTANYFATGSFTIGNCSGATYKAMSSHFNALMSATNGYSGTHGGIWQSTSAVTSVALWPGSGNLVAGSSLTIYGLK